MYDDGTIEWDYSTGGRWPNPRTLQLTFVGRDSWSRPVYKSGDRLYVDVEPHADREPCICTKYNNEFDGEPDSPISQETQVEFIPTRDTW